MLKIAPDTNLLRWLVVAEILLCSFSTSRLVAVPPPSGPSAQPPYSLSVFAQSTDKYSQPDSIVPWHGTILVGFQNHVGFQSTRGMIFFAPDGDDRGDQEDQ